MPIKISCRCGQRFQAPDKMAGKKARCPKCGDALQIPAASGQAASAQKGAAVPDMSDLLDEIGIASTPTGGKRCPQCNTTLAAQATFCVDCGFDLQSQEYIQGHGQEMGADGLLQSKSTGNPLLDKAAKDLYYERRETRKSQDPRSWYTYFVGLMVVLIFILVGAFSSLKSEENESGAKFGKTKEASSTTEVEWLKPENLPAIADQLFWGAFLVSMLCFAGPWMQFTFHGFKENPLFGFLCLTFLFGPVYAFMRWKKLKRPFQMWASGFIVLTGSYLIYYCTCGSVPTSLF